VEVTAWAHDTIDSELGWTMDGRETGGGLFGVRTAAGVRIDDACGPGNALRQPGRMTVDWDYYARFERTQREDGQQWRHVGDYHAHPQGSDAMPSAADLRTWADALDHVASDVYVGVILTTVSATSPLRWAAWVVSREGDHTVYERAALNERPAR